MSGLPPPRVRPTPPPVPGRSMGTGRTSGRDVGPATGRTLGVWVSFASTNVEMAKVDPQYDLAGKLTGVGTITVQFLNGSQYEYADRPMADWYDLIESSSKGRFTYFEVRGAGPSHPGMGLWPHRQIRKATRTSAQVRALAVKRQPTTAAQKRRTYTRGGKRNAYGAGGQRVRPAIG